MFGGDFYLFLVVEAKEQARHCAVRHVRYFELLLGWLRGLARAELEDLRVQPYQLGS